MEENSNNESKFIIFVPEFSQAYNLLKKLLLKYKLNNENLLNELIKLQSLNSSDKLYEFKNKFVVETKYYIANIQLIIIVYDYIIEQQQNYETYKQLFKECKISEPDGLGFCMKIDLNKQFIGYNEFKIIAERLLKEYDPGLQFLFIDRKSNEKMEIQYEVFIITNKLCKDKSQVYIEYIYDDLEQQIEEQKLDEQKKLSAFEERYGVDRLAEIIDCNLWKGLKKKKMKGEQKIEEIKKVEEEKQKEIEEKNKNLTEQEKEIKQEIEMEQFSELIANMQNLRKIGQTLNDEERRKQAADLVTQMANLIGIDEDSDQDESTQQKSSSSNQKN